MGLTPTRRALAALVLTASLAFLPRPATAAHPNALWRVVHDLCVTDQRLLHLPAPCVEVDLKQGFAVVPDPYAARHLVLVPTRRVVGIESDDLQAPDAPNYWDMAWAARRHLFHRTGELPREDVGLAVNSIYGRSQDQLHIHIDCVKPAVRDALASAAPKLGPAWSDLDLDDHRWRARTLAGEAPGVADPFKLLVEGQPGVRTRMYGETLVLVGARLAGGAPGFVLLARAAEPEVGNMGHGEALLDKRCAVASHASL